MEFEDDGYAISSNEYLLSLVGNGVVRLSDSEYYMATVTPNGGLPLEVKVT